MKKILSFWMALIWLALAAPAQAQLNVSISGAQQEPIPVAFPEILSDNQGIGAFLGFSYASKVRDVVLADLERSGLFRIINERSYIQKFTSFDQQPIFGDNAQVLVQSYSGRKRLRPQTSFQTLGHRQPERAAVRSLQFLKG